ncbi:MAG: hypothetical protein MR424_07140 [Treponema sp.]|nr:hypothetical protein [Treponema sp.]
MEVQFLCSIVAVYCFDSGCHHSDTTTVTKANKADKNGNWGRTRDTSLDGQCMSVSEFQSCLWYYVPSFSVTMGGDCTGHLNHNYGEIATDQISDTYYDVTPDTSVVKSEQADALVVTFSHNGSSTKKYYPIYVETRNSACTSPEKRIKVKLKGLPPLQFRNQSLKSA